MFAERTFAEWKKILLDAKGVWAPVQTPSELLEDPQALANGYIREVEAASGTVFRMVPPRCSSTRRHPTSPGPPTTASTPTRSWASSGSTWTPSWT